LNLQIYRKTTAEDNAMIYVPLRESSVETWYAKTTSHVGTSVKALGAIAGMKQERFMPLNATELVS